MRDNSKVRSQAKCSPWSPRLRVGRGANDPIPEKINVKRPWRRTRPTRGCSAREEEQENFVYISSFFNFHFLFSKYRMRHTPRLLPSGLHGDKGLT
jgi:hypothetical protein